MNKEDILKQVGFDLEKAKQIHAWLNETPYNQVTAPVSPDDIITIVEQNGLKFVRVHVGKYDFCIDLHDAPNEMKWDEAMKWADDKDMRLFTLEEGLLMYCFKDEINAKLKEAGGDELREDDWYWSSTEGNRSGAKGVNFGNGYAYHNSKYSEYVVRPVAAFACVS